MDRAIAILTDSPLIDGHNDFPYMLRGFLSNDLNENDIETVPLGQTDLLRLRKGRVGGQFWSAYVPCPKPEEALNVGNLSCLRRTLQQIDVIHLLVEKYSDIFELVQNSHDILRIFKSGRIASLIGLEGLHQIAECVSALRLFHKLGVRYITLAHDCNNTYADSATAKNSENNGLSELGKSLIEEMNRVGMIVDLSHTSNDAQIQALQVTRAPVIFSHSSCATLYPHVRNVSDEVLQLLRGNNGIIMICFLPQLLSGSDVSRPSVDDVVNHIVYAGRLIGFEHVGIGSDFDGMLKGPLGLDDTSYYPNLVVGLLTRGISEDDIKKVLGHNIIRVLAAVEAVSREMKVKSTSILCDELERVWTDEQMKILLQAGRERLNNVNV